MGMKPRRPRAEPAPTCQRPDRDAPALVCGYPLPCPWHTAVIDLGATPARVSVPATAPDPPVARLQQIAKALDDGDTDAEWLERTCNACGLDYTGTVECFGCHGEDTCIVGGKQ